VGERKVREEDGTTTTTTAATTTTGHVVQAEEVEFRWWVEKRKRKSYRNTPSKCV
jgi:hypothetical protein